MFSLCAKIFKTRKKSCGKIDGLNHTVPAKLMCFGVIEGLRVTGSACRMFAFKLGGCLIFLSRQRYVEAVCSQTWMEVH